MSRLPEFSPCQSDGLLSTETVTSSCSVTVQLPLTDTSSLSSHVDSFSLKIIYYFCTCMGVMSASMTVHRMPGAHGGKMLSSDPWD